MKDLKNTDLTEQLHKQEEQTVDMTLSMINDYLNKKQEEANVKNLNLYSMLFFPDNTEILYSDEMNLNGEKKIQIYLKRPGDFRYDSAKCYLPEEEWEEIQGFDEEEMDYMSEVLHALAPIITKLARGAY